jgi:WD40 repeat protein
MSSRTTFQTTILVAALGAVALPAGEPVLRLESQAPLSLVTSTTFGPDSRLYVAGFDKVVRSWRFDGQKGWRPATSYRVPIGPGIAGALNDVAISNDGRWLATGGNGWFRKMADFRTDGVLLGRNVLDLESRREQGAVYLFDRPANASSPLTHHAGPVVALSFDGQTLASLAWEYEDDQEVGAYTVAVWDAPTKRLLAQTRLAGVPGPTSIRPGFLVRRLSPAQNDVAVVTAFRKESVHVWRPARAADWVSIPVGDRATSVVAGEGTSAAVGCMILSEKRWKPSFVSLALDGAAPVATAAQALSLEGMPDGLIVSAAASQTDSKSTAFVYRTLQQPAEDWLCAVGQAPKSALTYRRRLGTATTTYPPRVSISADGSLAAVASPQAGRFDLYSLTNPAATAAFAGEGTAFAEAAFVEKNGELGFGLTPFGAQGAAWRIFDPTTMTLNAPSAGWRATEHPGGQAIKVEPVDASTLRVTTDAGQTTIALEKAVVTRSIGMRPDPRGAPLLAVALTDALGQPELRIYRADTGEQLRRCTGHAAAITGLDVSPDGGLLLSTSLDRTVALWNVADLDRTVGRNGAVKGVTLDDERRVTGSEQPSLQVGDVIVGRNVDGKFSTFAASFDFHTAARSFRPGQTLIVVAERNGQRFEAAIPVAQGMDERKPLAQIYCRENGDWIAWSPFGPYDSNTDAAEEWIGWHFNPEKNAPVRFALGSQHRQQYRRPGLLRRLLQTRSLTAALDAWRRLDAEPPDPNIALSMSPVDLSRSDAWIAPKKDVELTLRITNADFPLERLAAVRATVDGEPVALERVRPTEYRGRVSFKKPGRHAVRLAADTAAPLARHFEDERVVLFAPPTPTLTPAQEWVARSKAKPQPDGVWLAPNQESGEFRLQTALAADAAYGPMAVQVSINGERRPNAERLEDLRLPLRVGENRIVVAAAPKESAEGIDAAARMVVVVRRTEPPETFAPPTMTVERVEVGRDRTPITVGVGGFATVSATNVRIVGRAVSKENVARLDVDGRPAAGFAPAKDAAFVYETTLHPGSNRIGLVARGASGVESRQEIVLDCKPPLPKAAVVLQESQREAVWAPEGRRLQTAVSFQPTAEALAVVAVLRRNGVEVTRVERRADDAAAWNVAVPLAPGENRLTVDVEAPWARSEGVGATVWVRRPPRLTSVASSPISAKPFVDLTAEVEALDGWPAAELVVNGRVHQEVQQSRAGAPNAAGVVRWKLVARSVSLQQGRNDFTVTVRNGEGESSASTVQGLVFAPPPPPKAEIVWLSPNADENRDQPDLDVHFVVESTTPIHGATLAVSGAKEPMRLADLKPTTKNGRAVYEVRRRLTLEPGRRAVAVRVLNDGGETHSERAVTFVPKPVTVKLSALESGGKRIDATRTSDGGATFGAVDAARQTLHGEVVFADANAPALTAPASLHVLVNGLQQRTVDLGPAEGNVRRFKAPIVLNRRDANHLYAEVSGLSLDADCHIQGIVAGCTESLKAQRIHFVLIGVGDKDEDRLRDEALAAFAGAVEGVGVSSNGRRPAFERPGRNHAVCGYVTAPTIREAVDKLRMELVENAARQEGGDVVVFYFRGQAATEQRRLKLLTSEPSWLPRSKFDAGDLATRFADVPGAQLLLLDVSPHESTEDFRSVNKVFNRSNACLIGYRRPPKEAPVLFSAFREAMPGAAKLGELQQALATRQMPKGVSYEPTFFPEPLEELALSR